MPLEATHQGYFYQDILSAYLIADALATGKDCTKFLFDQKKTPKGQPDKFDDIGIETDEGFVSLQIKYSNSQNQHILTKGDLSASGPADLALDTLFQSWKAQRSPTNTFRLCLAWDVPAPEDELATLLYEDDTIQSWFPQTRCYKIALDALWDLENGILSTWKRLKNKSHNIDRNEFGEFLNQLVIEVGYPKSSLLRSTTSEIEEKLFASIRAIGIGIYPNQSLQVDHVAHKLCNIAREYRSTDQKTTVSVLEIAKQVGIVLTNGAIEQDFPVDYTALVETPERIDAILKALENHSQVVITAEPGAGKSWFIANLERYYEKKGDNAPVIVKHYCYTQLNDSGQRDRITANAMYGSLIQQLMDTDENLYGYKKLRYGSNLEELNRLLKYIKKPTLLIVDGIDHIWRVYQKNRGGLTEDETAILQALARLDCSNDNVHLLVVSQPIEQLKTLESFTTLQLPATTLAFTERMLEKQSIKDISYEEVPLSSVLTSKSKGNALYTKYLVDEAKNHVNDGDFLWVENLPGYRFNLVPYYEYLYQELEERGVPYALCGSAFSLSISELKEILPYGNIIDTQVASLRPVLKYYVTHNGFTIYHESFKRFIIEKLQEQGMDIDQVIYDPLIRWLEKKPFFTHRKAYGHLLKLYAEVEDFNSIASFIDRNFLKQSFIGRQPYNAVSSNVRLLSQSLVPHGSFEKAIVINEFASILRELEHHQGYIDYLKAIQSVYGDSELYSMLVYDDEQLASRNEIKELLINQAFKGVTSIPWDILPKGESIRFEDWEYAIVQHLHTGNYGKLEYFFNTTKDSEDYKKFHETLLNVFDRWTHTFEDTWVSNVPSYEEFLQQKSTVNADLVTIVDEILGIEHFDLADNWQELLISLREGVIRCHRQGDEARIQLVYSRLSEINWFFNWVIFMLKCAVLEQKPERADEDIEEAFSMLVRDLEPFKGRPRVMDLYTQTSFIQTSFRQGLDLCNNQESINRCLAFLYKVIDTTTQMMGMITGPLRTETYLEIAMDYATPEDAIKAFDEHHDPLASRRVYSDLTTFSFTRSQFLAKIGMTDEAKQIFEQGVEYMLAYGYRKDRSLSQVLYAGVPYQEQYGTLTPEWFFDVYELSMTVVTHTDGKGTHSYPIEWFGEFIKAFPTEALQFLASETLSSRVANYHQETQLYDLLQDHSDTLDATSWFLLIRTLPIASSEKILTLALDKMSEIDPMLLSTYRNWVSTLPEITGVGRYDKYSAETVKRFEKEFDREIASKISAESSRQETSYPSKEKTELSFPIDDSEEALAYIEKYEYGKEQLPRIQQLLQEVTDQKRKEILRSLTRKHSTNRDSEKDWWLQEVFEEGTDDWLYVCVCIFVFFTDGWFQGLENTDYLKKAYTHSPEKTMLYLQELSCTYIDGHLYAINFGNHLIKSLSEVGATEEEVRPLLDLVKQLQTDRLPDVIKAREVTSLYDDLEGFNHNEIVAALLLSRLKTLTNLKTQSVVLGIKYLSETNPQSLIKPLTWIFKHKKHVLPIHRAYLLQVAIETFIQEELPESLLGTLIASYPTGYFLEDWIVYELLDRRLEIPDSPQVIAYPADRIDQSFLRRYNPKYGLLNRVLGLSLDGVTNAFRRKREQIQKEYAEDYSIRTEKLVALLVPNADAMYSIANQYFYEELWNVAEFDPPHYFKYFHILIDELCTMLSSQVPKPSWVEDITTLPSCDMARKATVTTSKEDWVVLATKQKHIVKNEENDNQVHDLTMIHWNGESEPEEGDLLYSRTPVTKRGFLSDEGDSIERPISKTEIFDMLESVDLLFVSPYILNQLELSLVFEPFKQLHAVNNKGEIVITFSCWKEEYVGSISDGTEYTKFEGQSVQIRKDYYQSFLDCYDTPLWIITEKEDHPMYLR